MHGKYPGTVEVKDGKLMVDGKAITVTNELDPSKIQWGASGADYVVESTGELRNTSDSTIISYLTFPSLIIKLQANS